MHRDNQQWDHLGRNPLQLYESAKGTNVEWLAKSALKKKGCHQPPIINCCMIVQYAPTPGTPTSQPANQPGRQPELSVCYYSKLNEGAPVQFEIFFYG